LYSVNSFKRFTVRISPFGTAFINCVIRTFRPATRQFKGSSVIVIAVEFGLATKIGTVVKHIRLELNVGFVS
jgi:hypothetical protein